MKRLSNLSARYPHVIIAIFLALFVVAIHLHSTYRHYNFTFETMAPKDTSEYADYKEFEDLFGIGGVMFIIAFEDEPLVTNENLAMIDRIMQRIEALDGTDTMVGLSNALDIRATEDGLDVSEFVERIPLDQQGLDDVRERLLSDPLMVGNLISADGTLAAMIGRFEEWSSDPEVRFAYFNEVDRILAEEGRGRVEFHQAGVPYMDRTLVGHIVRDTAVFIPMTILIFALLLWAAFGQMRAIWMPLLPVVIAGAMTLGALSGSGTPMSVLTGEGLLMTLIMVLGLSNSVHLLNRYQEDVARAPDNRPRALAETLRHIGVACFLTSVTTAIGFISLTVTDIPTLRQFGIFGSAGILFAYAGTVLLLPATIVVLERWRATSPRSPGASRAVDSFVRTTAEIVIRHPRTIIAIGVAIFAGSAVAMTAVEIDSRFRRDLKSDDPAVRSMDFIEARLGGAFPLHILVKGDRPDTIKRPEVLAEMEILRAGMEALPTVSKVISPTQFIKKMNRAMNEGREDAYRLPETKEAVAQYLLLFEMAGSDNEFDRLVSYDYSTARMTARTEDHPPAQYRATIARLHELVADRFPEGVEVYEAGEAPLFHTVTTRLIGSLVKSLYFAMPLIFLITALAFRSGKLALLCILPNVLPLTVGMGFLGLTGISLRFSTIVAFPVAFGLAIDGTIHFLARYRLEIAAGRGPEEAVRATLTTAGRAMVMTTVFLVSGYAVMLFSNFMAMVHMALLMSIIVVSALVGDLLVLPALLLIFRPEIPAPAGDNRTAAPRQRRSRSVGQ